MKIECAKVDSMEIYGLGGPVYRYYRKSDGETMGYVGLREEELCFFSFKPVPLRLVKYMIQNAESQILSENSLDQLAAITS